MKIHVEDPGGVFEEKLRRNIVGLQDKIIFDITTNSISQQILSYNSGRYTLSYSRPIWFNILKPPLSDFEFEFSLVENENDAHKLVVGAFGIKRYVWGALLFVLVILLYRIYQAINGIVNFDWFSIIVAPILLLLYLSIEYFFFRKKIKAVFNRMIKQLGSKVY